ncbi:ABC transporter ATP-binding protein [Priestia megaterium]|jgi:putative ABC transport system ATP-binding protein|uniref:ABC transporter ATP-binding protein n=1 Tax=Priestia megaterium TaxID=1404 RepID=UPI0015DBD1BF|nr:ABC transporter ATP-binding protein [Priestia megaterium]MBD8847089.1 ABC transporter ATP-binding protein [Priestia megaterium]MED4760400.1 ABC transporter ATP-binding protein [Priestia megaterium]QLK09588.1 ABC transporter ATP-binding protein YvcR [Priestia megaterium]QSX24421.1 ABC transporter ATP-binding protein [Priestia megaterium]
MNILEVKNLTKIYEGKVPYKALDSVEFSIQKGEFVGIMGPSGSGKTTLLNMVSTIDSPNSGEVIINKKNPHRLSRKDISLFRRRDLGFVFQYFNLLDTLTVEENILLPLTLDKINVKEMNKRVEIVTQKLGIHAILKKRTYEISGGQMQRTAIARAIIHSPQLILADEPTGNLDSKASKDVMLLLQQLNEQENATMMMVTHDTVAASYCNRVIFIKDGKFFNEIYSDGNQKIFHQKIINLLSTLEGES